MNRVILLTACLVYCLSTLPSGFAQSTHDLEPPTQADLNSQQVIMSPDPAALPVYQFAVASLNDAGEIEVVTRKASQTLLAQAGTAKAPEGHVFYTENVTQNYTVMVPQQKERDGQTVTVMVPQTRTRTVPVQRTRKMTEEELAKEKKRKAEQGEEDAKEKKPTIPAATSHAVMTTYEVRIPYTEVDEDGTNVQKWRTEKRTRTVQVMRGKTKTDSIESKKKYKIGRLVFFDINGQQLKESVAKQRLGERQPVVLIRSKKSIAPYFAELLKPETLFVIVPEKEN